MPQQILPVSGIICSFPSAFHPPVQSELEDIFNEEFNYYASNSTIDWTVSVFLKAISTKDEEAHPAWFGIPVAIISLFGVLCNGVNLAVLTRRRLLLSLDRLERSSNYGLFALAFSDLVLCLMIFPHGFIRNTELTVESRRWFVLYYKVYGVALINLFMMISMWQVVSMALHRYMIVVYPLQARMMLSKRHTYTSITTVYTFSLLLSIPHFVHMRIHPCKHNEYDKIYLEVSSVWDSQGGFLLRFYIRWLWPVLAVFIPVIILLFCNCRLVRELHQAVRSRGSLSVQPCALNDSRSSPSDHLRYSSLVVTLTLVVIVLIAIFLVAPVEVIRYVNPYKSWQSAGEKVVLIGNLLQTVGFASNFLLYCTINVRFRQTLRGMLRCPKVVQGVLKKARTTNNRFTEHVSIHQLGATPLMLNPVKTERNVTENRC